ncbi:unnamed protein product [Linum tenue]|uniref:Secreted protein n=1 Tax=Linum tenue TaxID=586396 RepID=A0AAV0H0F0_9ROSI|nr:unnamed protein product [Linum tenue]CAI0453696.1 unnamed protein product [Linum tenue]CAI0539725.1 unnamed protein product [Linum tenue]CAI0555215.1 unnamed protein product [Linum tenue]
MFTGCITVLLITTQTFPCTYYNDTIQTSNAKAYNISTKLCTGFISISKVMTSQSHAFSSSTTMSLRYLNSVMGKKFTVKIELDKTQRLTIPYFSHHRMESTCL